MSRRLIKHKTYRLKNGEVAMLVEGSVVIYKKVEPKELDVTSECSVQLKQSKHTNGYYCAICHNGKQITALGIDESSKHVTSSGSYRLVLAEGAVVSFRVLKKVITEEEAECHRDTR